MKKSIKIVVLAVFSVFLVLLFSNFNPLLFVEIPWNTSFLSFPILGFLPLFFGFIYANIYYVPFSYADGKKTIQKILVASLNGLITFLLFVGGFQFWKLTGGNTDVFFLNASEKSFQFTFRNLLFWIIYQSLMMIYFFSILKILVSQPKK